MDATSRKYREASFEGADGVVLVNFLVFELQWRGHEKRSRINNPKSFLSRRRALRSNLTRAEALLWANLKNSKLDGKKFRRQQGIGPYIADFYWSQCRVIVELDGAGHYDVLAQERDGLRTIFLKSLGLRVLRSENCEVMENLDLVLEAIRGALRKNIS